MGGKIFKRKQAHSVTVIIVAQHNFLQLLQNLLPTYRIVI